MKGGGKGVFAEKALRTILLHPLGASEIVVALLGLRRYPASAFAATHEAAIQIRLEPSALRFRLSISNLLNLVEKRLGDDRLVPSHVFFFIEADDAVVDGVLKHPVILRPRQQIALAAFQADGVHFLHDPVEGVFAGSENLERFSNDGGLHRVDDYLAFVFVVQIADGGRSGNYAVFQPLTVPSADIFREGIDIVFRLAEHDGEHEFALRRRLKPERREFKLLDLAGVDEKDDTAAVNGVAGEAVGVPRHDAGRFARFDASKHFIEHRTAGRFGALLFDKRFDDIETVAAGNLPKLGQLVMD